MDTMITVQKDNQPADGFTAALKFEQASHDEVKKLFGDGQTVPEGYIAGWASTSKMDSYNDIIMPGAFEESIKERGLTGVRGVKLLLNHNRYEEAGVIRKLEYRDGKLWMEAQLALGASYVRDAYEVAKLKGGGAFSVGFRMKESWFEEKESPEGVPYRQIHKGDLFEVSYVSFPANEEAAALYVKNDPSPVEKPKTFSEFEKALVALGFVKSRNDAHTFVTAMKQHHELIKLSEHLFAKKEEVSNPGLDMAKINELTALVSKMKAALAPVAE